MLMLTVSAKRNRRGMRSLCAPTRRSRTLVLRLPFQERDPVGWCLGPTRCGRWPVFSGWTGGEGRGGAGVGELKLPSVPNVRKVVYNIDIKRVMRSKLVLGIADGWLSMDGDIIYRAKDLKVGLFKQDAALQPGT
jgi:hypothetical protein